MRLVFVAFALIMAGQFATGLTALGFDPPTIPADVVLMVPATVAAVWYLAHRAANRYRRRPTPSLTPARV